MISSYLLSSTLVPVVCVWLLKHRRPFARQGKDVRSRANAIYESCSAPIVAWRFLVVPAYLMMCGLVLWQLGTRLGTELFPQVDNGEFVLRYRPAPGTNFEITRQMGVKIFEIIQEESHDNIDISIGYAGQIAPNFGMNNIVLFMRGPRRWLATRCAADDSKIKLSRVSRATANRVCHERIIPWMEKCA